MHPAQQRPLAGIVRAQRGLHYGVPARAGRGNRRVRGRVERTPRTPVGAGDYRDGRIAPLKAEQLAVLGHGHLFPGRSEVVDFLVELIAGARAKLYLSARGKVGRPVNGRQDARVAAQLHRPRLERHLREEAVAVKLELADAGVGPIRDDEHPVVHLKVARLGERKGIVLIKNVGE